MTEARPNAWLGVHPGEGVYLGVGETGRRFRRVEELNRTIRSLENIIGATGDVRAFAMPNVFIRISEGRICIQIYGETSASFDEDHAVDLLDQLKLLHLICQSPTGRQALGFEAIRWPRRSSRNTRTPALRSNATSAAGI